MKWLGLTPEQRRAERNRPVLIGGTLSTQRTGRQGLIVAMIIFFPLLPITLPLYLLARWRANLAWLKQQQQAQVETAARAKTTARQAEVQDLTTLKTLADLKDRGVLTEREFQEKKKRLLDEPGA